MDNELREYFEKIESQISDLKEQTAKDIANIKEQTLTNCAKLDRLSNDVNSIKEDTKLLPQILEIVTANGNNHEELSKRVDRLESS